jgi:hypothetical protein
VTLPLANQVLHGAGDVLDGNVRVDAVLIEEIDPIRLESLQRSIGDLADVCGPAVQTGLLAALELEAELRRNHHLVANRAERFPDELFVRERAVGFSRVEERDASVNRRSDDRDAFFRARGRPVAEADPHAAKPERRHVQTAFPQCSLLHCSVLLERSGSTTAMCSGNVSPCTGEREFPLAENGASVSPASSLLGISPRSTEELGTTG